MNLRSVSTGNLPSNSGVWMSDSIDIRVAPLCFVDDTSDCSVELLV